MRDILPLFDEVLSVVIRWAWLRSCIRRISKLILRRVYSSEETEELRGISEASGVDMYFLVTLNVLLDSLMGCTSGGALTKPGKRGQGSKKDQDDRTPRVMHFRTLDWEMNELRSVLVLLEFVKSKSQTPEKIVARTVTYAGFVGVLTGVRLHQALVLLGFRPSIVSILRRKILLGSDPALPLEELVGSLACTRSAPCFLVLASPSKSSVIEKDLIDGKIRSATDFIVHTNHDIQDNHAPHAKGTSAVFMGDFIDDSEERRECLRKKWNALVRRQANKRREKRCNKEGTGLVPTVVREKTLQGWVEAHPIMNEYSHFGCIMDPKMGTIRWIQRGVLEVEDDGEGNDTMQVSGPE